MLYLSKETKFIGVATVIFTLNNNINKENLFLDFKGKCIH